MDSGAVVFEMAYTGGFRAPNPPGFQPTPRLRVFADGRVVTGQNRPDQPVHEFRLTDRELHDWMNRIVNDFGFTGIVESDLRKAMEADPDRMLLMDAPTCEIRVQLAESRHEVRIYAVGYSASVWPEIEPLQRLAKIEKLGQKLVSVAELGGTQVLHQHLEFANQELEKRQLPFRLSPGTFHTAEAQPNGRTGSSFRFRLPGANEESETDDSFGTGEVPAWTVVVTVDDAGKPSECQVIDSRQPRR